MKDEGISRFQHCTSKKCRDTTSHTADWCGSKQKRRCGCVYCYSSPDEGYTPAPAFPRETEGTTMTYTRSPFTVCTFGRDLDPAYTDGHDDLHTARYWTMHLRVPDGETPVTVAQRVLWTGAECLTGDYVGGDSFVQWCESRRDDEPAALHVYLQAPTLADAQAAVRAMSARIGVDYLLGMNVALSTGRDWAEQAPVWG